MIFSDILWCGRIKNVFYVKRVMLRGKPWKCWLERRRWPVPRWRRTQSQWSPRWPRRSLACSQGTSARLGCSRTNEKFSSPTTFISERFQCHWVIIEEVRNWEMVMVKNKDLGSIPSRWLAFVTVIGKRNVSLSGVSALTHVTELFYIQKLYSWGWKSG